MTHFFTMPPSATPPFNLREPPGRMLYSDMSDRDEVTEFESGPIRNGKKRPHVTSVTLHRSTCTASVLVRLQVITTMAVLSSPLVLIQSIPPVTRTFTLATIVSTATYAYLCWKGMAPEAARYMTLVPGSALYAPWTLFTSAFIETSTFEVSVTFSLNFNHPDILWR